MANGKKDTFFGLIFCFPKTEPVKNYFFALSKLGAFGVILTMQLEPPKPVKPVPSAIGGVVMGVDVVAAGSGVGSVVAVGKGDAWRPEALGAPSKVESLVGSCSWSTPSSAMLSPASFSLSLILFTGLVSTSSTERAQKAD